METDASRLMLESANQFILSKLYVARLKVIAEFFSDHNKAFVAIAFPADL